MSKKKNPLVFLDVSIGGEPVQRIIIEVSEKAQRMTLISLGFLLKGSNNIFCAWLLMTCFILNDAALC